MTTISRQFGRLTVKGPGENAKVSVLLADFENADKMLTKILESTKTWRDSWTSILAIQLGIVTAYEELYAPIAGATETYESEREAAETPRAQMERTSKLREYYAELRTDLLDEIALIDARIIKPAIDAQDYIKPVKKTIKKRENKKLDFERYQDRVGSLQRKLRRSDRENANLAKAEVDLGRAREEFIVADQHLRDSLPPLVAAVFSILPFLLGGLVITQNALVAQYYTILHGYCEEEDFPSPPPPMDEVIALWDAAFKPAQQDLEASMTCLVRGKGRHTPMSANDDSYNGRNGTSIRSRPSVGSMRALPPPTSPVARPVSQGQPGQQRMMRVPSHQSMTLRPVRSPEPPRGPSPEPEPSPGRLTPASSFGAPTPQSMVSTYSPAGPNMDYFSRERQVSSTSISSATIASKKKPPPPPPKRVASNAHYVVAIYDFEGQSSEDLSFREGDKILVVKKTQSTDDWWTGELRGRKGAFPANYCQ